MQNRVMAFLVLCIMVCCSGCGNNSTIAGAVSTLSGITTVALSAADIANKTFYSTTISGAIAFRFNSDGSASWSSTPVKTGAPTLDKTGSWQITPPSGTISLTGASPSSEKHQYTCIQQEASYWLISDESGTISRFYFDVSAAQTYNATIIGGSVQGAPLSLAGTVSTIAGAGIAGAADGTGTAASFGRPNGIATDGVNLYVADYMNNTIRQIVIATGVVTTIAGSGFFGFNDGIGTAASFNRPNDIATDGTNLYVVDSNNNTIRKMTRNPADNTWAVSTFAGSAVTVGATLSAAAIDSPSTGDVARFNQPVGITTDGTNLYVSDANNHTIRKIRISPGTVTTTYSGPVYTLAGAAGIPGSDDGIGTTAHFNVPARLTTDGSYLYLADYMNNSIRRIAIATGKVTTLAGAAGNHGSADNVIGTAARFYQPNGITTDGKNLYVTDSSNNTIRKIVIASGTVTTVAGQAGSAGAIDGAGTEARFDYPIGITTDGTSLYVTGSWNYTVRKIK